MIKEELELLLREEAYEEPIYVENDETDGAHLIILSSRIKLNSKFAHKSNIGMTEEMEMKLSEIIHKKYIPSYNNNFQFQMVEEELKMIIIESIKLLF